ncbi:MAG: molybdopterin adenylyltransferase [Firmicutes bacterium]|nr:molybdopterin adenylyltransferase [Bacillota bacterium]
MSEKYKVAVVTMSDKGSAGQRTDESGPLISAIMGDWGHAEVVETRIIPDDFEIIKNTLIALCDETKVDLILTTGGTGLSPRDVTPEATMAIADRNVPGIAEYMRAKSFEITPKAMLSRAVSVMRGKTLIINLPGSPKAVRENLGFILPALDHGLEIMTGRGGECGKSK